MRCRAPSDQIVAQNRFVAAQFARVFGPRVVPVVGNNDFMPHNLFFKGPNAWTAEYLDVWADWIPQAQRHDFARGGWFVVEVIPGALAVISLNTMYFFTSNSASNGCAVKSEPGYEHMDWLRIRLQTLRDRGMKAILIGHVPPARTRAKTSWDETCWQKFALWNRQYRDVVVSSMFGHMNVDHFMLQSAADLADDTKDGKMRSAHVSPANSREDVSTASASSYLRDLRDQWAELPADPEPVAAEAAWYRFGACMWDAVTGSGHKRKQRKYLDKIGGRWGEQYSVSLVSPSIIPNYYPSLRVFEYNITGLEGLGTADEVSVDRGSNMDSARMPESCGEEDESHAVYHDGHSTGKEDPQAQSKKKKKKKKKKHNFVVPDPPSKSSPPGPAYSPQALTLLGYVQYFANLTRINNDFTDATPAASDEPFGAQWKAGKHRGKTVNRTEPHPQPFRFEVEYRTRDDDTYRMQDLTVRSYLDLAKRIGGSLGKRAAVSLDDAPSFEDAQGSESDTAAAKKHRKKRHRHKHRNGLAWPAFVTRAFVSSLPPGDLVTASSQSAADVEDPTQAEPTVLEL